MRLGIGVVVFVLGLPFFLRGLLYTRRPEHPRTLAAKKRNLKLGMDSDMTRFGRRVRRFGFLMMLAGAAIAISSLDF